ncbi:tail protein [Arthrobacter phage Mendel]|uniref:Major tail protein n=1 Tax=Arthrobacter phage Mendel TaxID=2484218 RepID=A0A3G3M111_9CAUD|nr:tail protein [Arthrobacter phage Mendel]AYQ99927.1 major tail protein [Arthrobacter phage Mendel]
MSNQLQQTPTTTPGFGYGFNYAVWSAGTTVTLANVNWDSTYRDVWMGSPAELDDYILNGSGPVITTTGMTYAAMGRPIHLDIPFERANTFNYLRAYNPAQPVDPSVGGADTGRAYYYFIQQVEYVAPNTTRLIIQLDAWQTFIYGAVFGNCYIERGHVGIANVKRNNNYGRDYLTQPEGLDIGGEYHIVDQWKRHIASAKNLPGHSDPNYAIMVTSTTSLTEDPGTVDDPNLTSATGSTFENLPNGASNYLFETLSDFKDFMFMFASKPWVTQGIVSITAIPNDPGYGLMYDEHTVGTLTIKELKGDMFNTHFEALKNNWREYLVDNFIVPRYQHLDKFKVYPYTVLEMTSYTGTPLLIKPESWANPNAIVVELPHLAPPAARIMFAPYRYNAAGAFDPTFADAFDSDGVFHDDGEFLDMACGIMNLPTFSLVNNGYMMFAASNAHGIAFQHSAADWAQQRALAGNDVQYGQAQQGINTSMNVNRVGVSAAQQSTSIANDAQAAHMMLNGIAGTAKGAITGAAGGGAGGAAAGAANGAGNWAVSAIGTAIDTNARNQQLGVSNAASIGVNSLQNQQAGYVADTNKTYGDFAARGDYQNTIAGINAKIQDAKLIQPTTSGQVGGDAFNLTNYKWGYDIKVKMLQPAAMASIGEYWLRYGYAVNRFGTMPANFMACEKFTYWKLRETYITHSSCPETFKQTLRGIFEKGVTVWANPDDIGTIDIADNAPLEGISL